MFKRLLIVSGLLAFALTGLVYSRFMVPKVDVGTVQPVQAVSLPVVPTARDGAVVTVHGIIDRTGTTLLGKREVLLTDSGGTVAVMCTFVIGKPTDEVKAGDAITVRGVWHPIDANGRHVPEFLGKMTDCLTEN